MSAAHHNREWALASLKRRDLDGWRCSECGRAGRLEVHHVKSMRDGGGNELSQPQDALPQLTIYRPFTASPRHRMQRAWAALVEELL